MASTRALDENYKQFKKAVREGDKERAEWFANNVKNDLSGVLAMMR